MQDDKILDDKAFGAFSELMGDNLKTVLLRHLEVADGYINTISQSLAKGDFGSIYGTAHPLSSSSRQIGAFQVADIAAEIENLSKTSPNIHKLSSLILQLEKAQSMVDIHIRLTIN